MSAYDVTASQNATAQVIDGATTSIIVTNRGFVDVLVAIGSALIDPTEYDHKVAPGTSREIGVLSGLDHVCTKSTGEDCPVNIEEVASASNQPVLPVLVSQMFNAQTRLLTIDNTEGDIVLGEDELPFATVSVVGDYAGVGTPSITLPDSMASKLHGLVLVVNQSSTEASIGFSTNMGAAINIPAGGVRILGTVAAFSVFVDALQSYALAP